MKFGEKIRMERKRAGLTQQDLADAVGVSLRTIANYERQGKLPKKRNLSFARGKTVRRRGLPSGRG